MTDYPGKQHVVFFNSLVNGIENAIRREDHYHNFHNTEQNIKLLNKFKANTEPALRGAALVTIVASVEYLVGKNPDKSWAIPQTWYGRNELKHVRYMRHCWAHAAGKVLLDRKQDLTTFLVNLNSGLYHDRSGNTVPAYFSLDNDFLTLNPGGLARVKALAFDLLKEKQIIAP